MKPSPIQLLQLFFTLAIAAIFLGETVGFAEWASAAAVMALILWGRSPAGPSGKAPAPRLAKPPA